ncbi:MAG: hypothetical protein U9N35_03820 [Euryarchaeota archaeon]|nr:hypothetical protein [Euryarchaeota archaeon]
MNSSFVALTILAVYLIVIIGGGYLIRWALKRYKREIQLSGLKDAGLVIGMIERVLVLTFVLVGEYTAITIIFAAKSIARFNDLKNRKMSEYYLIGTFLSIAFAMIVGIIAKFLIEEGI